MGQSSEAIELRVTEPSQRQAAGKDIFLETVVNSISDVLMASLIELKKSRLLFSQSAAVL